MTLYEDPERLDDRFRSRLDTVLQADERVLLAARCDDALLDRWATRVVVTSDRVVTIRKVVLEWDIGGIRHEWIENVERRDDGVTVRVERESGVEEFTFPAATTAEGVVDAIDPQSVVTVSP